MFPYIFGLLPSKTEANVYQVLSWSFNRVRRQGNNLDDILVDFEKAAFNTIQFNIWDKIFKNGPSEIYGR